MAEHDGSYKLLFSHPRMVRDFLQGFVDQAWVEELDFTTLEKMSQSYVAEDLRGREEDAVWKVEWRGRGERLYIYLLFEFQSTVEPFMALRVLGYVALLYQDLVRREELTPSGKLPPVLPIVLYNGRKRWRAVREVSELIETVPGGLEAYRPRLAYLLVDEERVPAQRLGLPRNVVAALFRLEQSRSPEDLPAVVGALADWLAGPDHATLRRALTTWMRRALLPARFPGAKLPAAAELTEVRSMLEERALEWTRQWERRGMEKGLKRGRGEGRKEGRKEGEARLLLRQLERRFGPVDAATRALVTAATDEELLTWAERVLNADSLAEVFEDR